MQGIFHKDTEQVQIPDMNTFIQEDLHKGVTYDRRS
jgi:hypothetical protein